MSAPELVRPAAAAPLSHRSGIGTASIWRHHLDRLIPNSASFAAVLAITVILVALAYGMNHNGYIVWGGFLVAPVLIILSLPIANRAARLDGDAIGRIVLLAAGIKILITPLLRYWMAFSVYGGTADAGRYHEAGAVLAPLFRHGIYTDLGQISGTRFIEILTGQLYVLTGPTRLGAFMVFSWFAFLGYYLFYRAFRVAYPDGDGRRYALLVFFFPTLLFWPSSVGKEAFMMLVLGAAALGTAQLIAGRFRGLVWLALGVWGAAILRPHMALILGAGLVVAAPIVLLTGGTRERRQRGRLGGAVLVLALLLAGSAVIGVAEEFLGLESLGAESTQEKLDIVSEQTAQGGSHFTTVSPNNPLGFAVAFVTVLFRPFPIEAHNVQAVLAGLEGVALLLVLCVGFLRRLFRLPRELLRRPYAAFALVYTFAFVYAFSSVVNFGILARQRAQLLPFLFVVMCIPYGDRNSEDRGVSMTSDLETRRPGGPG